MDETLGWRFQTGLVVAAGANDHDHYKNFTLLIVYSSFQP